MIFFCLPLLAWVGIYLWARELSVSGKIGSDWRISWLVACSVWGALLTVIVEVNSFLRSFSLGTVSASWVVSCIVFWGVALVLMKRRSTSMWRMLRDWGAIGVPILVSQPLSVLLLLGMIGIIVVVLGLIALWTPTTNWDSMTYHMPRVMHWIQQRSVEHYATANDRQLESGPFSGFAIATLVMLYGDDRFANMVQWFSMLSSVIAVTLIANHLFVFVQTVNNHAYASDLSKTQILNLIELFAALISLPIGITQSVTTQNDYVVVFWVVCVFCFVLLYISDLCDSGGCWFSSKDNSGSWAV